MTSNKLPIEQIAKLANDVRLIKDFAENHNFDTSLLSAQVTPAPNAEKKADLPLIIMIASMVLLICMVAVLKFWTPPLGNAASSFIFLVGLLFTIIASMSAHMRFNNSVVTAIVGIGLLMVLLIGAGVFTPKEAVDKVGEFAK